MNASILEQLAHEFIYFARLLGFLLNSSLENQEWHSESLSQVVPERIECAQEAQDLVKLQVRDLPVLLEKENGKDACNRLLIGKSELALIFVIEIAICVLILFQHEDRRFEEHIKAHKDWHDFFDLKFRWILDCRLRARDLEADAEAVTFS
jgi:hypothetical protein